MHDAGVIRRVCTSRGWGAAVLAVGLALVSPATAKAPARFGIPGFDLLQVNQEVVHVKPGGSHPLCQAIPITAIRVKAKWSGAHPGDRVTVSLRAPGETTRARSLTLGARTGTRSAQFDPRHAFRGGTYTARIRSGGRLEATASFRLTQATKTC